MTRRSLRSVSAGLVGGPLVYAAFAAAGVALPQPLSWMVRPHTAHAQNPQTPSAQMSSAQTPSTQAALAQRQYAQAQLAQKSAAPKAAPAAQGSQAPTPGSQGITPAGQPVAGQTSAPGAQAAGLDDVIKGLEGAYGRINDLKAEFSQNAFNKSLNQSIPASGAVFLKKGGKLRWEYAQPTPQQTVSDGKTLWVYTPTLNQVNIAPAPEALAGPAGSFLVGLGKLREHFGVRFLNPVQPKDADGNYVLDLAPKQPLPTLSRLILSIDPKAWEVRKAVVYDQFENTVTMRFTKMALNSGLPDTLFTFTPPKGVATVPMQ